MATLSDLLARSESKCELCEGAADLDIYEVTDTPSGTDNSILVCSTCRPQLAGDPLDANHWYCLQGAIWSQTPAVQVQAWRLLHLLPGESWAQDLLDQAYLEDDIKAWAEAGVSAATTLGPATMDSNGTRLSEGDSVTLIKDLNVKGAGFTAKRGTMVKNIHLTDNPEHIEGRVNGVSIVLVTQYLKKA